MLFQGLLTYYHRIVLEHEEGPKGLVLVKCDSSSNATRYQDHDLDFFRCTFQNDFFSQLRVGRGQVG